MIRAMDLEAAESLVSAAEDLRGALRGPRGDAAMRDLESLYPDFITAFELLLAAKRHDAACRLATALVPFWMATKRLEDGDDWLARATASGNAGPARARAIYAHGYLLFWSGQYERSGDRSRAAVAAGRAAESPTVVSLALTVLARIALNTDPDEAKRLLREAIAVVERTDDVEGRSGAMHVLGVALQMSGDLVGAREVMSDRLALGRRTSNDFLVAVESANLSMVERQLGNLEAARSLAGDALETFHRLGDHLAVAWSANSVAAVAAAAGELERAATMLGFAEAGIERAGGEWPPDERQQYEATLATLRDGIDATSLETARGAGRSMSTVEGLAFARSRRAAGPARG
jgi:tetratricopeptide (TPR) repeat protein